MILEVIVDKGNGDEKVRHFVPDSFNDQDIVKYLNDKYEDNWFAFEITM
jgi:hypothetical protein